MIKISESQLCCDVYMLGVTGPPPVWTPRYRGRLGDPEGGEGDSPIHFEFKSEPNDHYGNFSSHDMT